MILFREELLIEIENISHFLIFFIKGYLRHYILDGLYQGHCQEVVMEKKNLITALRN